MKTYGSARKLIMIVAICCFMFSACNLFDCSVITCEQIEDAGFTGTFRLVFNFGDLPAGRPFLIGQSYPGGPWIEYPLATTQDATFGSCQELVIEWTNGELFEFTYGVETDTETVFTDPGCSQFRYPLNAPVGEQHFGIRLGKKKSCSYKSLDDPLIQHVEVLGENNYQIYLDFSSLNLAGAESLFVFGQSAPNDTWIDYQVSQDFPCVSFTVNDWPGGPYEFSYGIIHDSGDKIWVDPTTSDYLFEGHLKIQLGETTTTTIDTGDCVIKEIIQIEDNNLTGNFEIVLSGNIRGDQIWYFGQVVPDGPWVDIPITNHKVFVKDWIQGRGIEFSLYTINNNEKTYIDPRCSEYAYPPDANPNDMHFRVILGQKRGCAEWNINDPIVVGVTKRADGKWRVYLDFSLLPLPGYQNIYLTGQSAPDSPWIEYRVYDESPCYYADIIWPDPSITFHFSGKVIKKDGSIQWFDPNLSSFNCDDHLCLNFSDFS